MSKAKLPSPQPPTRKHQLGHHSLVCHTQYIYLVVLVSAVRLRTYPLVNLNLLSVNPLYIMVISSLWCTASCSEQDGPSILYHFSLPSTISTSSTSNTRVAWGGIRSSAKLCEWVTDKDVNVRSKCHVMMEQSYVSHICGRALLELILNLPCSSSGLLLEK